MSASAPIAMETTVSVAMQIAYVWWGAPSICTTSPIVPEHAHRATGYQLQRQSGPSDCEWHPCKHVRHKRRQSHRRNPVRVFVVTENASVPPCPDQGFLRMPGAVARAYGAPL